MNLEKIYNACMVRGIQQKQKEFTELMQIIIDNKYKSVLEIGAYSNGCTYAFASLCKKVVSIDLNHRSTERFNNVTYITGNSHEVRNDISGKFDVIFIDGDHTYAGVKKDFELYSDLINKGGIICFHDIWDTEEHHRQCCYVDKFWNEIKENYKFDELGKEIKTWGGIGVLYV